MPTGREAGAARSPEPARRPLIVESEAIAQLRTFADAVRAESPDARVIRAVLEDGESEARLLSSEGVNCDFQGRAASLYVEVAAEGHRQSGSFAAGAAEDFDPAALARRFATLLSLARAEPKSVPAGGEVVLAPAVATRLLAGLLPILLGPEARGRARSLSARKPLASSELTVIDDGGLPGGILRAAFDGEGVPTRAVALIHEGVFRQPLLSWRDAVRGESSGCSFRPSWRQPPEHGPTHLFVKPDAQIAPGELVRSVRSGFYALEALTPGRFDLADDWYELPVTGFCLEGGQATAPVPRAQLKGSLTDLLRSIRAVARDLAFQPIGCLLGAPTLLLASLRLDS